MVNIAATATVLCAIPHPLLGRPPGHIQKVGQPLAAAAPAAQTGVRAVDAGPGRRWLEAMMLLLKVDEMTAS